MNTTGKKKATKPYKQRNGIIFEETDWRQMRIMPKGFLERKTMRGARPRIEIKIQIEHKLTGLVSEKRLTANQQVIDFLAENNIKVKTPDNFKFTDQNRFDIDTRLLADKHQNSTAPTTELVPSVNTQEEYLTQTSKVFEPAIEKVPQLIRTLLTQAYTVPQPVPVQVPGRQAPTVQCVGQDVIQQVPVPVPVSEVPVRTNANSKPRNCSGIITRGDVWPLNKIINATVTKEIDHESQFVSSNDNLNCETSGEAVFLDWLIKHKTSTSASDALDAVKKELDLIVRLTDNLPPEAECYGNRAFYCPTEHTNVGDSSCRHGAIRWQLIHKLLGPCLDNTEESKQSLQAIVEETHWKTSDFVGLFEIALSKDVVLTEPYHVHTGPFCHVCQRRVDGIFDSQREACQGCFNRAINHKYVLISTGMKHFPYKPNERLGAGSETLYFLCVRKSSKGNRIKEMTFDQLRVSIAQSEMNPGPFGETNRPGFPQPWRVAAKFASSSCALAPLSAMIHPTRNQPADVYPLSMLADCIVSNYYPLDTIVVAMSHPSSFCVGHQDIDNFIRELSLRGIPSNCIFFYYHGLEISGNTVEKCETIVSGLDLRLAIRENLPRYGIRPALSGVLYAADQATNERGGGRRSGRNHIDTDNKLSGSQMETREAELVFGKQKTCAEPGCGKHLNNRFAINCVHCENWFHAQCVDVSYGWLRSIQYQRLAWICCFCNFRVLLAENEVVSAMHLAFEFYDHRVFAALSTMDTSFDWSTLFKCFQRPSKNPYLNILNNAQMDYECLVVCAKMLTVGVFKKNPALSRLQKNQYKLMLLEFLECEPDICEDIIGCLRTIILG